MLGYTELTIQTDSAPDRLGRLGCLAQKSSYYAMVRLFLK